MTDAQRFGKRLKAARKSARIKQGSLGKSLGVDAKHISRLECGKAKPSFDLICEASRILKVSPSVLFEFDVAEEDPSVMMEKIRHLLEDADIKQLQRAHRVLRGLLEP